MSKRYTLMFLFTVLLALVGGVRVSAQDGALDLLTIQDGVVQISTPKDLANFAEAVNDGNSPLDAVVTQDLDFADFDGDFSGIGLSNAPYVGTFDGQGHRISNLTIDGGHEYFAGLFRMVGDGTVIKNLTMDKTCSIINGSNACAMVASNYNGARCTITLIGLGNEGTVESSGQYVGAIAAINYGFNATYIIKDCWSTGDVRGTLNVAQICGHLGHGQVTGCWSTSKVTCNSGTTLLLDYVNDATVENCYSLGGTDVQQFAEQDLSNGALCYRLNGDQTVITWTQTIGEDALPQYGTGSKQVYASGTLRCDGKEYDDDPIEYNNTGGTISKPDHQFGADGICSVCGAMNKSDDGFYLIANAEQFNWIAQKVADGETEAKIRLTADIDLAQSEYTDVMIGTSASQYGGEFDGQGHTVTYSYTVGNNYSGLFSYVKGATIRNLRVEGEATVTAIHFGALIGRADGDVLVENVITNVNITGQRSGVTGDAGMLGALYGNITFNYCATLGAMGGEGSSMYCGFVAWQAGGTETNINNSFTMCSLTEGTGLDYCYTFARTNGKVNIKNCYYLNTVGAVQGTQVTADQIANGELCYKLNGDQSNLVWRQTLDSDDSPVPFDDHQKVYSTGEKYVNIQTEADFKEFASNLISAETEKYNETFALKTLLNAYLEALEELKTKTDIDSFMKAYNALADLRKSIDSSAKAYTNYLEKVDETLQYLKDHPELNNEKSLSLKSYLTDYNEPTADYPNGSVYYILDNGEMNEEQLADEIAFMGKKLAEAISYTPAVGGDVTMLLVNADFSDKFNGWEGKKATSAGSSEQSPIRAAECFNNTMDMYQTLTGLQNGIYELQINGAYRPYPYNDYYNTNYAAMLYLNGIHNYFQTNIEDMVSTTDAVDGENCHLTGSLVDFSVTDGNENVVGYTMQGIESCCIAFKAGRYQNSVLCRVTDGTLTVGIRQPGSGQQPDWLGFGNIKLTYYGELSDAVESLDRVLESMSSRARTIIDTYHYSAESDYATYPNFSQALKDELSQTLKAASIVAGDEAKYALIEKFSTLFLQIYECKQAYISLMAKANMVNTLENVLADVLSDDEFDQMEELYQQLTSAYEQGTMSAEEALSVNLKQYVSIIPEEKDGYVMIETPMDYIVFASMVSAGSTHLNAKLNADIDLRESDAPSTMIGKADAQYSGIFDGQGHTLTYSYEVSDNYSGMFRYVNGATIRNLRVEGNATVTAIHYGGLIGMSNGNVLVENVITNVNITGQRSGVTGDAGMLGALYGSITFNNCATLGAMGGEGSSMYCGFVAWDSGSGVTNINNCYTTCSLTEGTGVGYCYTFARTNGKVNITNSYYLNAIGTKQGTQMTLEQFKSGEVCYKLNGDQSEINWYQTLGEDELPVLDETHATVFLNDNSTYSNTDGIQAATKEQPAQSGIIYNLQGQRVQNPSKGIYIIDRKKVMIK